MGLFQKITKAFSFRPNETNMLQTEETLQDIKHEGEPTSTPFDEEAYQNVLENQIGDFKSIFDLDTIEGIEKITTEEAKRWSTVAKGVPALPEQILFKKATEFKNNGNMDLAIACLKKANELLPVSSCLYSRDNFERLVNYLIIAGKFGEAREEHSKLNNTYGSTIDFLEHLKESVPKTDEEKQKYQEQVINPKIEEERDREEYYWLLENMPDDAPKSFSGYRRMKSQNTENYKKLFKKVQDTGNNLHNITFWI